MFFNNLNNTFTDGCTCIPKEIVELYKRTNDYASLSVSFTPFISPFSPSVSSVMMFLTVSMVTMFSMLAITSIFFLLFVSFFAITSFFVFLFVSFSVYSRVTTQESEPFLKTRVVRDRFTTIILEFTLLMPVFTALLCLKQDKFTIHCT